MALRVGVIFLLSQACRTLSRSSKNNEAARLGADFNGAFFEAGCASGHQNPIARHRQSSAKWAHNIRFRALPVFNFMSGCKITVLTDLKRSPSNGAGNPSGALGRTHRYDLHNSAVPGRIRSRLFLHIFNPTFLRIRIFCTRAGTSPGMTQITVNCDLAHSSERLK